MASIGGEEQTEVTFSQALRKASWALHGSAEGSHFMKDLLEGQIQRPRYAEYVRQLHEVYRVLEEASQAMREQPTAQPFVHDGLSRLAAIEDDLRYFYGDSWAEQVEVTEATRAYCDRLREVCFTWPGGFVAHHYTRYMGDLSGGQMIGRVVEKTYELAEHNGARFYRFDAIPDPDAFKNNYREQLDQAQWDPEEQMRIIDEVLLAYRLNTSLLAALD